MPLPANLADANEGNIRSLLTEGATEGPHLDLKRDMPRLDAAGRHELLADVSAFANSTGGDLVYGVEEDGEGRAAAIQAIAGNADEEARRLLDSIANGLEPRAPGIQVQPVAVDGGFVLVVRVPQSWAGPHRVRSNQHFFVREGARKRQLDMPEIRGMFLRSDAQVQRVRDFRTERVGRVLMGDTPVKLISGPALVVHLIPTQAALGLVSVDPVRYQREARLPALGTELSNARLNMDGAFGARVENQHGSRVYALMFRNGFLECVNSLSWGTGELGRLPSVAYEKELIQLVDRFRRELQTLGIGQELTVMWTLVRANDVEMALGPREFHIKDDDYQGKFDRQVLALPDVLVPTDQSSSRALRPLFDLVWQSAGFTHCYNYTEEGDWSANA
jgi:hypothetical protein